MPTYEYECRRCGHTFEEFRSITASPRSRCPKCRGKVERLIGGGIGIHFKGSGFYVNDSRPADRGKKAAPAGGGGDAEAGGTGPEASGKGAGSKAAEKPGGGKSTAD